MNHTEFESALRAFKPFLGSKPVRSSRLQYAGETFWDDVGVHPLDMHFTRLADFYGRLRAAQRRTFRNALNDSAVNNLVFYVRRMSLQIMKTKEPIWLDRALAAASLENARIDYRDSIVSLVIARAGAEAAGIDPRPHFDCAITRCDPTMVSVFANARDHRPRDVRDILREFGPPVLKRSRHRRIR